MTSRLSRIAVVLSVLSICLALLAPGCRKPPAPPVSATEAAIVPNADVFLRCDLKSARATPIGKRFQKIQEEKEKTDPALLGKAEQRAKLERATGLKREDVDTIVVTAALAGVDLKDAKGSKAIEALPAVLAI